MAEAGRVWTENETRALLEIWSEESIQRQLDIAVRNDKVYAKLVSELAKRGFFRTVPQCRTKIKALKRKYKEVTDKLRRSGQGRESDDEDVPTSDFTFFKEMDAVMGGRASVAPVHVLDSSAGNTSTMLECEGDIDNFPIAPTSPSSHSTTPTSVVSRPTTPASVVSRPTTPASVVSRPTTPASVVSHSATPASVVSRPATPASVVSCPTTPDPTDSSSNIPDPTSSSSTIPDPTGSRTITPTPEVSGHSDPLASRCRSPSTGGTETAPKKKRKRTTKIQKAERASENIVKELIDAQERARKRFEEQERKREEKEDRREEMEAARNQQFLSSVTQMMTMMSQFMGAALYPPSPFHMQPPMHPNPPPHTPQSPSPMQPPMHLNPPPHTPQSPSPFHMQLPMHPNPPSPTTPNTEKESDSSC